MSRLPRLLREALSLAAVTGFVALVVTILAVIDPSRLPQ